MLKPRKRVLLVDDNATVRSCVRGLFALSPEFEIVGEAENGQDALEKAEQVRPDVIVLDLIMPVMTGLDAAPRLKKLLPDAVVILFTQQAEGELQQLEAAAGIDAVVSKCDAATRLVSKAKELVSSRQRRDSATFQSAS